MMHFQSPLVYDMTTCKDPLYILEKIRGMKSLFKNILLTSSIDINIYHKMSRLGVK